MGFFRKLFDSGNDYNENKQTPQSQPSQEPEKIKSTIYDFFNIDIKKIPDESFVEAGVKTNESGDSFQTFRKSLDNKECGIFDTVELHVIDGKSKNISFKTFNADFINIEKLKRLIDDLYLIYGTDDYGNGRFNNDDRLNYLDSDNFVLFGRRWGEYPKYQNPVAVERDGNEVILTIWGVENS